MNRRIFCRSSAAAAVSLGAGGTAVVRAADWLSAAGKDPAASPAPLYKILYDPRFAVCGSFAAAALQVGGSPVQAVGGDVTALWSNDLRGRWMAGEGAVGGMLTERSLFCLEELAKNHWMRVVLRVEHGSEPRMTASERRLPELRTALNSPDWPAKLPAILAACAAECRPLHVSRCIPRAAASAAMHAARNLVSFVIV